MNMRRITALSLLLCLVLPLILALSACGEKDAPTESFAADITAKAADAAWLAVALYGDGLPVTGQATGARYRPVEGSVRGRYGIGSAADIRARISATYDAALAAQLLRRYFPEAEGVTGKEGELLLDRYKDAPDGTLLCDTQAESLFAGEISLDLSSLSAPTVRGNYATATLQTTMTVGVGAAARSETRTLSYTFVYEGGSWYFGSVPGFVSE